MMKFAIEKSTNILKYLNILINIENLTWESLRDPEVVLYLGTP